MFICPKMSFKFSCANDTSGKILANKLYVKMLLFNQIVGFFDCHYIRK